jgi:hypothetical protein
MEWTGRFRRLGKGSISSDLYEKCLEKLHFLVMGLFD